MPAKKQAQQTQSNSSQELGMSDEQLNNLIQIGGLWANKSKSDEVYFSGYLGNAKLLIFKNKFKKENKHPHYVMYVAENGKKSNVSVDDIEEELNVDDIPF